MKKICANCNKEFFNIYKKVKTCSRECGYALTRKNNEIKAKTKIPPDVIDRRPSGKGLGETVFKKCAICDKTFAISKTFEDRYFTCSSECSSKYRKRKQLNAKLINKICRYCKKPYDTRYEFQSKFYCSDECRLNDLNSKPRTKKKMYKSISRGYVRLTFNNPDGSKTCMLEHRYIMEQKLGRKLTANERVHHINGIKTDNSPENLMLFASQSEHIKYEFETKQRTPNYDRERDEKGRYS